MKFIKSLFSMLIALSILSENISIYANEENSGSEIVTEDTFVPVTPSSSELENGVMGKSEELDFLSKASRASFSPYWITVNNKKNFYDGYDNLVYQEGTKKIIDVSFWQGTIDWEKVKADGIDGAILRVGYGYLGYDSQFKRNVSECNRLGIPYGVYLYSYAYDANFAYAEANGTAQMLSEVDLNLSYPIYYDIEAFGKWIDDDGSIRTTPSTVNQYESIISTYINRMNELGYKGKVHVYSYRYYIQTKLNSSKILPYVSWIAEYGSKLNYTNTYYSGAQGWQYSSSGKVNGISGNVDMNCFSDVFYNKVFKPTVKSYTGTYDGKAHSITLSGVPSGSTIKYRTSTTGSWTTTKPSKTIAGTTTVYYQITHPNYNTVTGSAKITINKATRKVSAIGYTGTYDGKVHSITLSGVPSGSTIKYRTSTTGSWTTTKPSRTVAGTTTVYYQITHPNYNTITGSSKITVNKKSTSKLTISSISNKTYTGKQIRPTITVKNGTKVLKNGTDYTVSYGTNKNTGSGYVKIIGKGNYTGTVTKYFNIVPKVPSVSLKAGSKSFTVTSKSVGASGYQIAYSTSKTKGFKYVYAGSSKTITGLKKNTTYYVKVRAYKVIDGKRIYGSYSSVKTIKTK